jgi:4-amino-4-deoxy-L-arabinose transferase-like glycosyltransferase
MQALRLHGDIALVVTVAFAIRVAFFPPVHTVGYTSDEREYIAMAGQLAQGGEYVDSNGERSTRAPLYPFVLALFLTLGDGGVLVAHLFGCLVGAGLVLVGFLVSLEVWGNRRAALFAAGIMAAYPGLVIYASVLQTETLYTCLMLLALWLTYQAVRRPGSVTMVVLGAVGGFAALTRAVFLGFYPILLAGVWWHGRKEAHKSIGPILLSALVFCAVLAPWTIRNYHVHGTLVPVSTGGGNSLLTGNNPFATGTWRLEPGFQQWFAARAQELGVRDVGALNEVQRSAISGRIAREYIASHPLATLSLLAKKAHVFFVYPITNTDSGGLLQAFALLCDIVLLIGAVAGFASCVRIPGRPWALYAEARFRLPLVPVISLFAGLGVSAFLDAKVRREILAIRSAQRLLIVGSFVVLVVYGITGILAVQGLV